MILLFRVIEILFMVHMNRIYYSVYSTDIRINISSLVLTAFYFSASSNVTSLQ